MAAVAVLLGMGLTAPPADAQAKVMKRRIGCSTAELISAINTANTVRTSTIMLASNCSYDLLAAAATGTRGDDGLPIITENVTLVGNNTTIRRFSPDLFRVAEVACGGTLVLRGVTISGGDSGAHTGGGILNARGTLSLIGSVVTGNAGDNGAGISNDRGTAYVYYSVVHDNDTRSGGGGGAIYSDGTLFVYGSVLSGNTANTTGGAIHNEQGGTMSLSYSTVTGNHANMNAGGIYNGADSSVSMLGSLLSINDARGGTGEGGGVYNLGRLSASSTRFYFNAAPNGIGGAIRNAAGPTATVVFDRGRIDYNSSDTGGGGIDNTGNVAGQIALSRSVVIRNTPNNCAPVGTIRFCVR